MNFQKYRFNPSSIIYKSDSLEYENLSRQSALNIPVDIRKRQSSQSPDLSLVLSLTFMTALILLIASSVVIRPRLENHEMCGITTGGQEECYFNCSMVLCSTVNNIVVKDLPCLLECFRAENCVSLLLNDVISKETCSIATETQLRTNECLEVIYEQQPFIRNTIIKLINKSCSFLTAFFYFQLQTEIFFDRKASRSYKETIGRIHNGTLNFNITRIPPVQLIYEKRNLRTKLQYENTKNRYPWVCSLRGTGPSPAHRCAVNLLSIPPGPTVVVGAAHCTYLCKDGTREVPVCCCSDGTDDCRESNTKCGKDPGVVEMTGADSFVLCGEWDSSQAGSDISGERYNVNLPIIDIIRHPNFDPAKGPINGNDVVVFKIDDSEIQNGVVNRLGLWPACLPSQSLDRPKIGIHTGWSEPPSFSFVQSQAPGYAMVYNDFYKQWHYKMDILDICEDPKDSALCGGQLQFPSNSSYPAGTMCAKAFTRQSCFSTGESGSPLMVQYDTDSKRYHIEGILSFVKGCDRFEFGAGNDKQTSWILTQQSENPTTYSKLSCFLPWIAAQYNMKYEYTGSLDQACNTGSGDPLDGEKPCRNTYSNNPDFQFDREIDSKFPFYYKGKKYEECILLDEDGFVYPIFRCPIRDITTKINGTNSFEFSSLVEGICLSNVSDDLSQLDPSKECGPFQKRLPFAQCKNNCPGVRAFGIVGGGATLAAVATLGTLALSPISTIAGVGTLGTLGVGGALMMARSMCFAPLYCISLSGKCCLVVLDRNLLVCPDTCVN